MDVVAKVLNKLLANWIQTSCKSTWKYAECHQLLEKGKLKLLGGTTMCQLECLKKTDDTKYWWEGGRPGTL